MDNGCPSIRDAAAAGRNQDGLVCWTKQARLIAQGLISADVNWRAGQGPAPTGISVMGDTMAAAAMKPILYRRTL